MTVPEEVFSAKQAADRLGLSPAMTRRYGAALEELTGEAIRQHPRDGRQYGREQLETMQRAKSFVESNPRLSVVQALTLALGAAPEVATPAALSEPGDPSGALVGALTQALERSLLPELRALRESNERLEQEVAALRAGRASQFGRLPEAPPTSAETAATDETGGSDDGPMVRAARWLERLLRR